MLTRFSFPARRFVRSSVPALLLPVVVACGVGLLPLAADPFVNLTFDEPPRDPAALELVGGPAGVYRGSVQNILPGWEVSYLGLPLSDAGYSINGHRGSIPPVTVDEYDPSEPWGLVGGRSGLSLRMGDPPPNLTIDLILRQRGEIPADAVSFEIIHSGRGVVRIDGSIVSEFDSELHPNRVIDVVPFAGKEVDLEIAFYHGQGLSFDILGFTSVPEPSTWALLGLGAVALGIGSGRKRRDESRGR